MALDLGTESGRAMLASFDGERIALQEAYRFANVPVRTLTSLHWDPLRLFDDIKRGLAQVAREHRGEIAGIGLDTWGVDFALLGRDDEPLGNPFHYHDARTTGIMARLFERCAARAGVCANGHPVSRNQFALPVVCNALAECARIGTCENVFDDARFDELLADGRQGVRIYRCDDDPVF